MLLVTQPICSNTDLARAVDGEKEDECELIHRLEVPANDAKEDGAAPQVIDVCFGYLVVGLN